MTHLKVLISTISIVLLSLSISEKTAAEESIKRVVFSGDVGLDDYLGLVLLLQADLQKQLKLEAIICSSGQTTVFHSCNNVVRLLELTNRTDIPVYRGVEYALIPSSIEIPSFNGEDCFGDLHYDHDPDLSIIQPLPGPEGLNELVEKYPGEISVIMVSPLTNYALAIKSFNGFLDKIKDLWIMGGNFNPNGPIDVQGDMTAELNFFVDVEAAFITLDTSKKPTYILPWETCKNPTISFDEIYAVLDNGSPALNLMLRAEQNIDHSIMNETKFIGCDAYLAFCYINSEEPVYTKSEHQASVILHDIEKRGQMVFDQDDSEMKINFIETFDLDEFMLTVNETTI